MNSGRQIKSRIGFYSLRYTVILKLTTKVVIIKDKFVSINRKLLEQQRTGIILLIITSSYKMSKYFGFWFGVFFLPPLAFVSVIYHCRNVR